jgi:hypothetical protein
MTMVGEARRLGGMRQKYKRICRPGAGRGLCDALETYFRRGPGLRRGDVDH